MDSSFTEKACNKGDEDQQQGDDAGEVAFLVVKRLLRRLLVVFFCRAAAFPISLPPHIFLVLRPTRLQYVFFRRVQVLVLSITYISVYIS